MLCINFANKHLLMIKPHLIHQFQWGIILQAKYRANLLDFHTKSSGLLNTVLFVFFLRCVRLTAEKRFAQVKRKSTKLALVKERFCTVLRTQRRCAAQTSEHMLLVHHFCFCEMRTSASVPRIYVKGKPSSPHLHVCLKPSINYAIQQSWTSTILIP